MYGYFTLYNMLPFNYLCNIFESFFSWIAFQLNWNFDGNTSTRLYISQSAHKRTSNWIIGDFAIKAATLNGYLRYRTVQFHSNRKLIWEFPTTSCCSSCVFNCNGILFFSIYNWFCRSSFGYFHILFVLFLLHGMGFSCLIIIDCNLVCNFLGFVLNNFHEYIAQNFFSRWYTFKFPGCLISSYFCCCFYWGICFCPNSLRWSKCISTYIPLTISRQCIKLIFSNKRKTSGRTNLSKIIFNNDICINVSVICCFYLI